MKLKYTRFQILFHCDNRNGIYSGDFSRILLLEYSIDGVQYGTGFSTQIILKARIHQLIRCRISFPPPNGSKKGLIRDDSLSTEE